MENEKRTDEEKRRHPRIPLDVTVNDEASAFGHTKNISEGGLCIITEDEQEVGKYLQLEIRLPEVDSGIRAIYKVMWVRKASEHYYESGLSVWDIKNEDMAKIRAYCESAAEQAE